VRIRSHAASLIAASLLVAAGAGLAGTSVTASSDKIEIGVSIAFTDYRLDWVNEVAAEFEANHPEYDIVVQGFDDYESLLQSVTLAAQQGDPPAIAQYRWMTFLSAEAKGRLYSPRLQDALVSADVYRPVRDALSRVSAQHDLLNRQLYADLSVYLADDILVKVDRMSMATSLETRAPFLDADVMELAFSMPGRLKIKGGTRKYILKKALEGMVPPAILARPKEGFSIPMKTWLRRELTPLMERLLAPARIRAGGLLEAREVARLIGEHRAGRANHAHVLFSLMVFERWREEFAGILI